MWTWLLLCTVCFWHCKPFSTCSKLYSIIPGEPASVSVCSWARTLAAHLIRYTCLSLANRVHQSAPSTQAESGALCCQLLSFFSVVYKNLWTRLHHGCLSLLFLFSAKPRSVWQPAHANSRQAEACSYSVDTSIPPGCVEVRVSLLGFIDSYCCKYINKQ